MEIKSKLYLVDEEGNKFMGIGVLWLLKSVTTEGSLRSAAKNLGMSYTKAYQMVGNLEKRLGCQVVDRRKGGSLHEGSSLTEFGKEFVNLYDVFQQDAKDRLAEPFYQFAVKLQILMKRYDMEDRHGTKNRCSEKEI